MRDFVTLVSSPRAIALACAVLALALYILTLAPGLTYIDSGELATVAVRLGIAHPTGYPLFTLVGRLFAMVPAAGDPVVRLNLLAALLCASAAGIFFFCVRELLLAIDVRVRGGGASTQALINAAAAGSSLLLACSQTFWLQAVAVEVYSLHLFLMSAVLASFGRGINGTERKTSDRWLLLSAYLLGLSFTNHMTTVLLIPGLVTWLWIVRGKGTGRLMIRSALPAIGALTLYLYLPIRSSADPVPGWGYPATAERLFWHVSGKQYRVWIFSSGEVALRQLREFLSGLPLELGYLALPLALGGLVLLWRFHRGAFWGTAVMFATCVVYASNYDIHDIDPYYLLALAMIVLWAGVGLYWLGRILSPGLGRRRSWAAALLFVPAALSAALHFRGVDASQDYAVEDYTRNMLASFERESVVLSYQWDYWLSASYYVQLVRGERPDLVVIDKELLRRSWYIRELRMRFPSVTGPCAAEIEAFLRELEKFERGLPYSSGVIQARFEGMIRALVAKSLQTHPVYVTPEIEPEFTTGFQRVPWGLAQRVFADTAAHDAPSPRFGYRPLRKTAEMDQIVARFYASAHLLWGEYRLKRFGDAEDLRKSAESALFHLPGDTRALEILKQFGR